MRITLNAGPVREIDIAPLKGDIDADLRSRDFTLNAMAALILEDGTLGDLIDPCGGEDDMRDRSLRMTSESALQDDPLRLLRAVRLAVELGFEIEDETWDAVQRHAALIQNTAAERQRDELVRILDTNDASVGLRLLDALGLLDKLLPELTPAKGVSQPLSHHYWDVFDHSIELVAALDVLLSGKASLDPGAAAYRRIFRDAMSDFNLDAYFNETTGGGNKRRVLLKLAGLLHDIAKPETKGPDKTGRIRFLGHPELGARKSEVICRRLRFSQRETAFVALLVDEHLRPTQLAPRGRAPSRRALYHFAQDLGEAATACLVLQLADGTSATGPRLTLERWQAMVARAASTMKGLQKLNEAAQRPERLVTGNDLMETLGLDPGPALGQLLAALEEAIGAGEVTTKDEAIALARRLQSRPASPSPSTERGTEGERS
jgi:poly(A) polymerase